MESVALCFMRCFSFLRKFSYSLVTKAKTPAGPGLSFQPVGRVWCQGRAPPRHQPRNALWTVLSPVMFPSNPHCRLHGLKEGQSRDCKRLDDTYCHHVAQEHFISFLLFSNHGFATHPKCMSNGSSDTDLRTLNFMSILI